MHYLGNAEPMKYYILRSVVSLLNPNNAQTYNLICLSYVHQL